VIEHTSDLWWKNAIFYCADVKTYSDSDGDGHGDLMGMLARLDHLNDLGVDCLWLMPIYPSPHRDDGYDITDYYGIDPTIGTAGDFTELMRTAEDRGIRIVLDLVVNHTSVDHPWYQAARQDPESPFRDFYVWCDEPPEDWRTEIVFPDEEDSNWEWDDDAGQYFLHFFYKHQPELNIGNPIVRDEISRIAGYWLRQGVAGFRVDAVPFLLGLEGLGDEVNLDPHDFFGDLRRFLGRRKGDAVLMGEVNLPPQEQKHFVGEEQDDQLQLVLNFSVNQAMYLALARRSAEPLIAGLRRLPSLPIEAQWANFARTHDELSLDQLTEEQRSEVFAAFGPEPDHQLFGRGLRRRVPSMLDGDRRRMELVYSLVMSLPGSPVLFYGEEIGMAESLAIPGRRSVRSPMQWTDGPEGGFSDPGVEPERPFPDGQWSPEHVNVADQLAVPDSFLEWMKHLIARRRVTPQFGWGDWKVVDVGTDAVLAVRYRWDQATVFAVHEMSGEARSAVLPLEDDDDGEADEVIDLLHRPSSLSPSDGAVTVDLDGFGYRWLWVHPTGRRRPR
jgi:trehalose synthase